MHYKEDVTSSGIPLLVREQRFKIECGNSCSVVLDLDLHRTLKCICSVHTAPNLDSRS